MTGGLANLASGVQSTVAGGFSNDATGFGSFAAGSGANADDQGAWVWADQESSQVSSPGVNTFTVQAAGGIWLGSTSAPSIPIGTFLNTSTGGHLTTGGAWTNASDRALKQNFAEVDGRAILRALALMPITSWSYKAEPGVTHVGPVAQDFKRAFGLGRGNEHIATVDADGVALAAIKALHAENRALEARLAKLERKIARLAARG